MHRNYPNHSLALLKVGSNTLHNTCIEIIQIILLAAGIPLLQKPQRNNHKTPKIWKITVPLQEVLHASIRDSRGSNKLKFKRWEAALTLKSSNQGEISQK